MKKIMFNETYGLETAVLERRKNKTRRFVPQKVIDMVPLYQEEYYEAALESISVADAIYNLTHSEKRAKAPFYVGEEVAIAQSMKTLYENRHVFFENSKALIQAQQEPCWNNKMFIGSSVLFHRIKFTDLTIERLQDISSEDCLKEGIMEWNPKDEAEGVVIKNLLEYNERNGHFPFQIPRCWNMYDTPRQAFADLIDKICGKGTWESNPWVFAYDFELIK